MPVHGTWVRHSWPGVAATEPLAAGSRWLRTGIPGVYLADNEETAWAEFYRALAESGRAPAGGVPRDLHRVSVNLDRVADLRTERSRREFGLPRMRATKKQWPAFQRVGDQLVGQAGQGILYSSAARTRSLCLCVFESGLRGLGAEGEPIHLIAPPPLPRGLRT